VTGTVPSCLIHLPFSHILGIKVDFKFTVYTNPGRTVIFSVVNMGFSFWYVTVYRLVGT
jgi:ABC-type sulfate transport system permease subunit